MRKLLFATILILFVASVSHAQFGIRGGLSMATLTGDDKSMPIGDYIPGAPGKIDPTVRTGFAAGVSYKIGLILGLAIEPGVYYVQNGAVYEIPKSTMNYGGSPVSYSGKATFKNDYLQIPLVGKFTLPIPLLSPYVEAGVAYNILLSSKIKAEATATASGQTQSESEEMDIKENMNKGDVSLVLGVGAELLIFDVNARLILGQSKIDKEGTAKLYNRTIMITAGVRL